MRVLDLFSGREGWSAAFRDRGHDVTTLDLGVDGKFSPDFALDILDVVDLADLERGGGPFDVVLCSPPCTAFSVAAMGKNWERTADGRGIKGPKHPRAELGMRIANHTFALGDAYIARHPGLRAVVENPVGAMRVVIYPSPIWIRRTTWQCQWGETRAKPTDLWIYRFAGVLPMCRQGGTDHVAAPRGSKTPGSTQGQANAADRSLIPYPMSLAFCLAAEGDGVVAAPRPVTKIELGLVS
jgi:hypothetical protein